MPRILVLLALLSVGCGAIVKGTRTPVTFASTVGAEVLVDGIGVGRTSSVVAMAPVRLQTKHDHVIDFAADDGRHARYLLTTSIGAGYAVFDALLGLIPVIVDMITGGWATFDETSLRADFSSRSPTVVAIGGKPKTAVAKTADAEERQPEPEAETTASAECQPYKPDCRKRR